MKKLTTIVLSLFIILSSFAVVSASEPTLSEDIVILYTNDVHTYIDGKLSYDVIKSVKDELKKEYKYVFLADAGDHIQGTAYGSMDNGESIIKLMNASGYDVATLGNHEFDYGMAGCFNAIGLADYPYISANFYNEKDGVRGDNVLDSFVMFECGKEKLALIGITTPETFSKSTPAYFQDENGEFIYGISGVHDPEDLYDNVQNAIDEAKKEGATKIVALGHLGVDPTSVPLTSKDTIASVSGLDAFIDGHSHTVMKGELVADKEGKDVLLTQTGNYFDRMGIMVIDSETGVVTTDFIEYKETISADGQTVETEELTSEIYRGKEVLSDNAVAKIKTEWINSVDTKLGDVIGTAQVVLDNYDSEGNRLVRTEETNSGDFSADAIYYLFDNMDMDVDVAVTNGGGVRNTALTGDITYKNCKDMHPFGNVACLQTVTGQQLLDALEWSSRLVGVGEEGSFLHVSGITYKIDTSVPNTTKSDDVGIWISGPEKYRVHDVMVYNKETDAYEPIDLEASYNLAGFNYTLRDLGGGFAMLNGAVNVLDYVMEDYMVLANYVQGFEGGVIGAVNSPLKAKYPGFKLDYGTVNGSGRIEIVSTPSGNVQIKEIVEETLRGEETITRAVFVDVLHKLEGEPAEEEAAFFEDVEIDSGYADAVNWAKQNGIVAGVSETEFAPDSNITREQIATLLYRYAVYKNIAPEGAWAIRLDYSDLDKVGEYAVEGLMYCKLKGIMEGKDDNTFAPKDNATGTEVVSILLRLLNAK